MKFQDIPANIISARVKQTDGDGKLLKEQPVFSVEYNHLIAEAFDIRIKDSIVTVKPIAKTDFLRINSELASGRSILAQLENPASDGSIELKIASFTGHCVEMGDMDIGVDEYIENSISTIEHRNDGLKGEQLYRLLDKTFCFHQGENRFFFLTAGAAIDDALRDEPIPTNSDGYANEDMNSTEDVVEVDGDTDATPNAFLNSPTQKHTSTRKNSLGVTGDGMRFVATETQVTANQSIFIATLLTKLKNDPDRATRLAKGKLNFVDWTQAGQIQILAKAQMSELTSEEGSYLKKWDEFGEFEGEQLLKRSREIGALHYSDRESKKNDIVTVHITEMSDSALKVINTENTWEVEIVDIIPDYLNNGNLTFTEFINGLEEKLTKSKEEKKTSFTVVKFDKDLKQITLKAETLPPQSGILILSLTGDIAQVKRRIAARRAILEGRSANPQLGLLIEEKGQITPTRQTQKITPLTAFVRDKIFRNPPTVRQEQAIDVALNTPDIALIQGPPGTGKTTVIAAILERLNEMADKRGANIKGQVLLTGFQHDAVDNMIQRLSINGLPVPKYGKRSGSDEDDFNAFEKEMEEWCTQRAVELRERNPHIKEIEQETEIKNLCLQYIQAPTRNLAVNLAKKIESLGVSILGEDCARRAGILAKLLSREQKLNGESTQCLDAARRLRIHPESFADDGADRAVDALGDLEGELEENERALLNTASLWRNEDGDMPFLKNLAELKKSLLIRFSAPPAFRVEKHSDGVIALAEDAIKRIKMVGYSSQDVKSAALAEYLAELESNPYGMIDAVSDYSFAFAATCQQSVNKGMQRQKGITGKDVTENQKRMEYEYVIVDEAARVSPRDLMVPMAQGKRIILVGDHRQLPHIIDEEVARQMDAGETGQDENDWLKKSMFHYLFSERLKNLENTDGITRRVTLDKQYRMHPILGDFISRNFYESFDHSEKFGSGRPASDFVHSLPESEGKPVIWLDIPSARGAHKRSGTSWERPVEATAIAQQLNDWINSEAGKNLSFGVISFYKAQAELIRKQLGNLADDDKKIRIGTVDSFQGMEFDVVFLSMVRTLPQNWNSRDADREKQARSLFGHLCLYNRLNVSMSRQKKLLVLAGDSTLLKHPLAQEFIPGLVDFMKLCQNEGKILQCR
jgi:hypothetical protein